MSSDFSQTKIKSEDQLYKHFKTLTKKGAEGVMISCSKSPYQTKRSSYLKKSNNNLMMNVKLLVTLKEPVNIKVN